ncbi:MAG TPA: methyltransferase domain-containing protein [Patescibacteria group bacterium]|nr:methyltransferase domain-containing protein [Patescibacteria group bacterium]
MPKIWPLHYALGLAGVAVIRNWMNGGETAEQCANDLRSLANRFAEDPSLSFQLDIPNMDVESGYQLWADTYDDLHNPLISVEEPIICRLLDSIPPGRALDAACGTGRYARYLTDRGHKVSAVDMTAEMLDRARANAPAAELKSGSLEALPFPDETFDLVMCGLALTHLPEISRAIAELARVLKVGGTAIIADHHPMPGFLGGSAIFQDKKRFYRNVRSYVHPHSEYIAAFVAANLEIRECREPEMTEEQAAHWPFFAVAPSAFLKGAVGMPMALIWSTVRRA